jgi:hypothetical protein
MRGARPPGTVIGSSNSRDQPWLLMAPALAVEVGHEASWHPRRIVIFRFIAPRAGRSGPTAIAGVRALPGGPGWFSQTQPQSSQSVHFIV